MAPERTAPRSVIRNALGIGVATGAYALSFGALSVAAGLNVAETCALSLLMFTGASQFALIGVVGSGGNPFAGAAGALLLGVRNGLYGLRLSPLLDVRGVRRLGTAQLVIDESTAMAIAQPNGPLGRVAFYSTGLAIYVLWNLGTLVGALAGRAISNPADFGLDAAAPAAFLALLAPRMEGREQWVVALVAGAVALASVPFVPAGVPVLLAAVVGFAFGLWPGASSLPVEPSTREPA
ncbi:MAG TPA: AzlC family ABC transporter permease [Actinomycetota bacterium]